MSEYYDEHGYSGYHYQHAVQEDSYHVPYSSEQLSAPAETRRHPSRAIKAPALPRDTAPLEDGSEYSYSSHFASTPSIAEAASVAAPQYPRTPVSMVAPAVDERGSHVHYQEAYYEEAYYGTNDSQASQGTVRHQPPAGIAQISTHAATDSHIHSRSYV